MAPAARFPANNVTEFFWYFTDNPADGDEPFLLPTSLLKYFDHVEVDVGLPGEGAAVFETEEEAVAAYEDAVRRAGGPR